MEGYGFPVDIVLVTAHHRGNTIHMCNTTSLTDHLLIAMPSLADPNFNHTVTYICEHGEKGTLGLVINRPLELTLQRVFDHLELQVDEHYTDVPVFAGGPMQQEHGFVLHTPCGDWQSSLQITDTIALTTSQDILTAIASDEGPKQFRCILGCAGWGPGQLEEEIAANSWLSVPAASNILFDLPSNKCWKAAAALLGIDLDLLSTEAGHA